MEGKNKRSMMTYSESSGAKQESLVFFIAIVDATSRGCARIVVDQARLGILRK